MFGLQFHPEVTHSMGGKDILKNFGVLCQAPMDWTMSNLADIFIGESSLHCVVLCCVVLYLHCIILCDNYSIQQDQLG
jgi:hypothetical protein